MRTGKNIQKVTDDDVASSKEEAKLITSGRPSQVTTGQDPPGGRCWNLNIEPNSLSDVVLCEYCAVGKKS